MITFIKANLGTILVAVALIAIVAGIIVSLRRDKKQGKSSCGGNCAHCKMCPHAKKAV